LIPSPGPEDHDVLTPPDAPPKPDDQGPARPPKFFAGHYRYERELGRGGMATVYLCTDIKKGNLVAVKVLRPELGNAVTVERFMREIALVSELRHPRIPEVLDSGVEGELPFYVMTYVVGEPLRNRIQRDGQLPVAESIEIAGQVIDTMSYAHERGILHRDIKPENILLADDGVHVLDFGIARVIIESAGDRLTATGVAVGTPAYMSPEQAVGTRDLDSRSDIYALACVVYELLAGVPPFEGPTPQVLIARRFATTPKPIRQVRPEVSASIERALVKALSREPEDRFATAAEFGEALRKADVQDTAARAVEAFGAETEDLLAKLKATFGATYKVDEELSGGGMSRLFLATDIELNRRVVIKILPPELMSPMMLARFKRESEVTARLQHPHILPVISAGVRDGLVHYVMPFIEGESLRARLKREAQMPIKDATRILREVVDALAYAHRQGIIHRDIKPENILIQDGHAIVADFGIAAALSGGGTEPGDRLTRTGMSMGTVGYMAPEQSLGEKTVDGRSDIYAVGVVGYEMFAGAPPFTGATDHQILVAHLTREARPLDDLRADTPPAVSDAIAKSLAKDPDNRFQTADEFATALEAAGTATAPGLAGGFNRRRFRRLDLKWKIALSVAAVAVVATIVVTAIKLRPTSTTGRDTTVAIAPFNVVESSLGLWKEGLVDVLARNLDGAGALRTVSPTLSIKGFGGNANDTTAVALARRTKARYAIYGSLVKTLNDSVRIRGSVLDVDNLSQRLDTGVTGATPEEAAGKFTIAALGHLGKSVDIGTGHRQSSFGSKSIEAVRAFLQGEQFYRQTAWQSAGIAYSKAISFDSSFALALRRTAQVASWIRNASDSVARADWIKAGSLNHGLAPRDSLLLTADSLSATLAPLPSDSMNWSMLKRLFETVNEAASRYPDDPEVWYAVGEARFHLGYGSPANITERQALDAFDKAIALDSAFAPAYVHGVELGFNLEGATAGRRYSHAYLKLNPIESEGEGIAIVDRLTSPGGSSTNVTDSILDNAPSEAIMAAYFTLRRWPDPGQTAVRILESFSRRRKGSPTFAADSIRLVNFLPLELAYRGRLKEAYATMGNRPSRIFVEIALLGGIPADTLASVIPQWIAAGRPQAFYTLPILAERRDLASINALMAKADQASRSGPETARRIARYRGHQTRAYLSLVKADTASALREFAQMPDTLCIACYMDRLYFARLLAANGKLEESDNLLGQRLNTLITPAEIMIAFDRGRVAAQLGKKEEAARAYNLVVSAWSSGDPVLQPYVTRAKTELQRLGSR
jgi:serine/threonine protein kinase/tetratricopeptide (TPR) repeat protein